MILDAMLAKKERSRLRSKQLNKVKNMSLATLSELIPDFAKDVRLNLSSVLTPEGAPDLKQNQIYAIALASAYATKQPMLFEMLEKEAEGLLSAEEVSACKSAASIMAMNNVYYRFLHLVGDEEYKKMPARLRMNIIGNPGIPKIDFELYCMAISAINGCGLCMEAHAHELEKAGVLKQTVQSSVRIAAVIASAAQVLSIPNA